MAKLDVALYLRILKVLIILYLNHVVTLDFFVKMWYNKRKIYYGKDKYMRNFVCFGGKFYGKVECSFIEL